jgi:SAM-dependent methyltransferase
MAGQRIPLWRLVRNGWQILGKHRRYTLREAEKYLALYAMLTDLLARLAHREVRGARVIEIGCGQRAALPLLFSANGAEATAVDIEMPTYRLSAAGFLRVLRANGLHRAAKSLVRHLLFDRRFYAEMARVSRTNLRPFPHVDVRVMDAAKGGLPRDSFDLAFSFNVLEHVVDVEATVRNISALLGPDGVARISVHLFPSLSGGHCFDWIYAMDPSYPEWGLPRHVPAWDHLRENQFPADSYLNRLRLRDYRDILYRNTLVVEESVRREGEHLLHLAPPELRVEYSDEDLTTAAVDFTIRKKR